MFLKNRSSQFLAVTYVALVIAIVVANSRKLIYLKVGCWPAYGDTIVHYGMIAMYILFPALSIFIALSRSWVKLDNNILKNIIGYAGGFSAGFFITLITIGVIIGVAGTYMSPSFEYRFGYPSCLQ